MIITVIATVALLLALAAVPLIALLVDLLPVAMTAERVRAGNDRPVEGVDDFTVLVPIYGNVAYLENIDYLRDYGTRVLLCTTAGETPDFYEDLERVAQANGFRVFVADYKPAMSGGKRQTGGVTRDRVIREALHEVRSTYVVCIDADTRTERPLRETVGTLKARGLDLASVRLVVSNADGSLLGKLQAHEYRMSMRMRRIMPWLCSGACHLGTTAALRQTMDRHSLFFQGNDAELGLLARRLGLTVGHIEAAVPTSVPLTPRAWLRQRLAWTGGEFRLYIVNSWLVRRHPWFILYGALLVFALTPLRALSVIHPGWILLGVLATYWIAVVASNRRHFDAALVLYPVYGLFNSLVMSPLGLLSYANMAVRSRNSGIIRSTRALETAGAARV